MTRSTRKRLFYVLVLIFFVASATVILYAEGWRFGGTDFELQKVGAVFVRSFPKDADITLNTKPIQNKTGFLSAGTLISDLFPTNYSITLKKTGYLTWTETVSVSPSLVTELKYAVLVPQNATSTVTSTIKNFFLAGGTVIAENTGGSVFWRGGTIGRGDIAAQSTDLKEVILKNPSTGGDTLYDLATKTTKPLGTFSNLMIDPYDAATAIAWNAQNIWSINLTISPTASTSTAAAASVPVRIASASSSAGFSFGPSVAVSQTSIAWSRSQNSTTTSTLTVYDKFLKIAVSTSSIPETVVKIKWINDGLLGAVTAQGSLYRYDVSERTAQKIADDVKDFYPVANGSELAVLGRGSIEIIPVSDGDYYRFNISAVETVKSLIWYKDRTHLFIEYPDHISFLDFADAGLHNMANVSDGTMPFYDASTNSLYLIDKGQKLLRFDFPN